ncbi:MAG: two-component regulator propeller domain-containing protein [Bacteroidia bacterium]
MPIKKHITGFTVYCLLFTVYCFVSFQYADAQTYKPVNISLSQGLAQSSVYSIVQDKQGFLWMATQDGLCRYDGLQFKIYRDDPFDTTTLTTNFITSLLVDNNGWLWVGTQNHGLNLFIPEKKKFRHFFAGGESSFSHDNITKIYEDFDGNIWVGTSKGFCRTIINGNDPATANITFKNYKLAATGAGEGEPFINSFYSTITNNLWVCTRNGLYNISFRNDTVSKIEYFSTENNSGLSDYDVRDITQDSQGIFWIATANGLNYISSELKIIDLFKKDDLWRKKLNSGFIGHLKTDVNGNLWIGTAGGGLYKLSHQYLNKDVNPSDLEKINLGNERLTSEIFSIAEDKINPGMMWIGTFAGGSYKLVPILKNFYSDHLEENGIPSPVVTSVIKDKNSLIWIGTQNGLIRQNKSAGQYDVFLSGKNLTGPVGNYISSVVEDNSGTIWVSTEMGIHRIENAKSPHPSFKLYPADKEHEKKFIRSVYLDNNNNLFLIYRTDVFKYNKQKDTFEKFTLFADSIIGNKKGNSITSVLIDRLNNCWIGTMMGLMVFREHNGSEFNWTKYETYYHNLDDTNTLRSQNIQSMMEDIKGNIWLSTSNGLTKAHVIEGKIKFTNYSTENKIKNNTVYGTVEDKDSGHLWLSTNGGLTRFDPSPGGNATLNFDINDGLQSNEFNGYAFSRAADGEIFFGGIQGYTSFYPSRIKSDTVAPKVLITDFVIPGKEKNISVDESGNKSITLKYFENSFTVDFIALHYHDPVKNQYAYKLEGFQQDWTYCGNSHQVNFSQLPPGKYVLKVIGSNNDGYFSRQGDSLTVIIKPPFYQTIWFYFSLLAFIVIVLWLLHIYRLQLKLAQVKEVERIRKETAADFHDELGHKLTTISWFSEILKKKIKPEQIELRSYLDKIIETSGNLYLTMKDLLWAMDPEKDSLYHMYAQLKNFGEELFDHTGIEFNANGVNDELKNYDLPLSYKRHILLIFKEVMHNSLKHASPHSTFLDLEKNNGSLTLRFGDNGKGFDTGNGSMNGNGIKNVNRRAELIHADINLRSNGTGTVFELKLNLN